MNFHPLTNEQMAKRVAIDIDDGSVVNLGIGLPTKVSNFIPENREVILHSENGILGIGPTPKEGEEDQELRNVNGELVTLIPGGSIMNHVDSFVAIRGGHIDISIMGAFQVSETGDLANWIINENSVPAIGGAMDLAIGAKKVYILMKHTTKNGEPRILEKCTYPLTAANVVNRIYTDLCVIDVTSNGLLVQEMIEGISFDELQNLTGATLKKSSKLKSIAV